MVSADQGRERAAQPEDLGRFFVQRANAGDLEGLVALYESDAVLAVPGGAPAQPDGTWLWVIDQPRIFG